MNAPRIENMILAAGRERGTGAWLNRFFIRHEPGRSLDGVSHHF